MSGHISHFTQKFLYANISNHVKNNNLGNRLFFLIPEKGINRSIMLLRCFL